MEVINKKHDKIRAYARFGRTGDAFVRVLDTAFYFTTAAERLCQLKVGEYVHFLNEGSEWSFYSNDDQDGFAITKIHKGRDGKYVGAAISNVALVRMFRKSTGFSHSASFLIERTGAVVDKCPVYIIKTDKPIT